jgi:hypothetical protein
VKKKTTMDSFSTSEFCKISSEKGKHREIEGWAQSIERKRVRERAIKVNYLRNMRKINR